MNDSKIQFGSQRIINQIVNEPVDCYHYLTGYYNVLLWSFNDFITQSDCWSVITKFNLIFESSIWMWNNNNVWSAQISHTCRKCANTSKNLFLDSFVQCVFVILIIFGRVIRIVFELQIVFFSILWCHNDYVLH